MILALPESDRAAALSALPHWSYDKSRRALYREIRLKTFSEALALMVRIGLEAEKADHHPEWSNVYGKVCIWLTTHDAGGVSERDVHLARQIDSMT